MNIENIAHAFYVLEIEKYEDLLVWPKTCHKLLHPTTSLYFDFKYHEYSSKWIILRSEVVFCQITSLSLSLSPIEAQCFLHTLSRLLSCVDPRSQRLLTVPTVSSLSSALWPSRPSTRRSTKPPRDRALWFVALYGFGCWFSGFEFVVDWFGDMGKGGIMGEGGGGRLGNELT